MMRYLLSIGLSLGLAGGLESAPATAGQKLISPTDPNYQQELMQGTQGFRPVPNQGSRPPQCANAVPPPGGWGDGRTKPLSPCDPDFLKKLMQGTEGVPKVPNQQ